MNIKQKYKQLNSKKMKKIKNYKLQLTSFNRKTLTVLWSYALTVFFLFGLSLPTLKAQDVRTINHIKKGNEFEIGISAIDSITFSNYSVPNTLSGVLINGVVWATCNVNLPGSFASKPEESGMFYQWNRNVGWSSSDPLTSSDGSSWDSSIPAGDSWASSPCPTGWRLPTFEEQQSLLNSGSFWGELNGVSGRFFGNGTSRVFFPAAGCRYGSEGTLYGVGYFGYYWSGTPNGTEDAYYVYFSSGYAYTYDSSLSNGVSVRCVKE